MNHYELTFLLEKEEDAKPMQDALKSSSGKLVEEKKWGARQFAYPIEKHSSAHYFTWSIEMDTKNVNEFKRN
jgi:ribosomal protein S6